MSGSYKISGVQKLALVTRRFFPIGIIRVLHAFSISRKPTVPVGKINLLFANIRSKLIRVTIFVVLSNLQKLHFSGA